MRVCAVDGVLCVSVCVHVCSYMYARAGDDVNNGGGSMGFAPRLTSSNAPSTDHASQNRLGGMRWDKMR